MIFFFHSASTTILKRAKKKTFAPARLHYHWYSRIWDFERSNRGSGAGDKRDVPLPAVSRPCHLFSTSTSTVTPREKPMVIKGVPKRPSIASLVVTTERESYVPTTFRTAALADEAQQPSSSLEASRIPLALNDVYVLNEQLPYAYFFKEKLCDIELENGLQRVLNREFPLLGGKLCLDTLSIVTDPENDYIPFAVGKTNILAKDWLTLRHESSTGALLPIFDPLPPDPWNCDSPPFARIRVTYIEEKNENDGSITCGGTIIGVNISHAIADGASCVHFMYCWGREHRHLSYPKLSHERGLVTTNGMVDDDLKELLNLGVNSSDTASQSKESSSSWTIGGFSSQLLGFSSLMLNRIATSTPSSSTTVHTSPPSDVTIDVEKKQKDLSAITPPHEFVLMRFPPKLLHAMKEYSVKYFKDSSNDKNEQQTQLPAFVSTNDIITAAGWVLMRDLSGNDDWGMNIIVNIRGRAKDAPSFDQDGALFGNGINAATAVVPPKPKNNEYDDDERKRRELISSAFQCRLALTHTYSTLEDKLIASRMGKPIIEPSRSPAFCTTSWNFPLWEIDFEDAVLEEVKCTNTGITSIIGGEDDLEHGRPYAFHGQPVHPLPPGETYAAVVIPTATKGLDYQLFLPLYHADAVKEYMDRLERLFLG